MHCNYTLESKWVAFISEKVTHFHLVLVPTTITKSKSKLLHNNDDKELSLRVDVINWNSKKIKNKKNRESHAFESTTPAVLKS